jgi:hypothetical protein
MAVQAHLASVTTHGLRAGSQAQARRRTGCERGRHSAAVASQDPELNTLTM